jgi:hypothetical protein
MPSLDLTRLHMAAQMLRLGLRADAWRWVTMPDDSAELVAAWAMMAAAWKAGREAAIASRD